MLIHRGVISTMERFTAILIETIKEPSQLVGTSTSNCYPSFNEAHTDYAWGKLLNNFVTVVSAVEVDERNEKMQYKIRASQTFKKSLIN